MNLPREEASTEVNGPKHLLSFGQLPRDEILSILDRVDEARRRLLSPNVRALNTVLGGKRVALVFLEPSTRTMYSFQAATQFLGGTVLSDPMTSLAKGETVDDTVRVISGYADVLVLRHPNVNTARLTRGIKIPVINAGDGSNEHPTQALVDLYTIQQRTKGKLDDLTVGVGFDPRHSRSIRSFCLALSKFENNSIVVVSPEECAMSGAQRKELKKLGLRVRESEHMEDLLDCEIVYLNRFQEERFADSSMLEVYKQKYRLTPEGLEKSQVRHILDPLPRVDELDVRVDDLTQAAYFQQSDYGLPVRVAVLEWVMEN